MGKCPVIIKLTIILGKQKTKQSDDSQQQGDSSNMSLAHTADLVTTLTGVDQEN